MSDIIHNVSQQPDAMSGTSGDADTSPLTLIPDSLRVDPGADGQSTDPVTLHGLADASSDAYDGFDPSRHAMNPDGTPRRKLDGNFSLKRGKGGRQPQKTEFVNGENPHVKMSSEQASIMTITTGVGLMVQLLGEQWDITDEKEAKILKESIKAYYDAIGGVNMSPATGVAFALAGYSLPRIVHPESQSRLKRFFSWIKSFFV